MNLMDENNCLIDGLMLKRIDVLKPMIQIVLLMETLVVLKPILQIALLMGTLVVLQLKLY
jgi:hypothetical protein